MTTSVPAVTGVSSRVARIAIALVRVGVAFMWIQNVSWKVPPDFAALRAFTQFAVDRPVFAPYAWLVENLVLPNMAFFGWVTLLLEASLGAFLLVGLATRLFALIGAAQALAIALSVLNAPHEWPWAYYLMIFVHLLLFAVSAGRCYGVDGALRADWQASTNRVARGLVLAS